MKKLIVMCLAAGLVLGCEKKDEAKSGDDKAGPAKSGGDKAGEAKSGGDKGEAKAAAKPAEAIKAKPAELYTEYKKDEKGTVAKYKGKTLEVEGEVTQAGQDFSKNIFVTLKTVDDDIMGMKVVVKGAGHPWATMAPGDTVKATGTWPEFSMGPALMDASIELVGKSKTATIDAKALVKALVDGGEAAEKTYENKWVRVSGTVTDVKNDNAVTATLDGGDGKVSVGIGSMDKWAHALAVKGKPMTALCKFNMWSGDDKEVSLYMCLPVKQ